MYVSFTKAMSIKTNVSEVLFIQVFLTLFSWSWKRSVLASSGRRRRQFLEIPRIATMPSFDYNENNKIKWPHRITLVN